MQNPCLRKVVTQLQSTNIQNTISEIISKFTSSPKINVTFKDVNETSSGAPANTTKYSYDKDTQIYTVEVTLSTNILLGTSREFVAGVIVHEIVHAYLGYKLLALKEIGNTHTNMATKYVAPLAAYVSVVYGISIKDATAMAWVGVR